MKFLTHFRSITKILKISFLVLLLGFIIKYFYGNWHLVLTIGLPDLSWVLLGSCFALVSIFLSPWVYKSIVQAYEYQLTYSTILGVQSVSRLGKYIPGKIWITLMGIWLYQQVGIPKKVAATSIILTSIISILGAIFIISLTSLWVPIFGISSRLVVTSIILLIAIHPRVFYPFLNFGLNLINHESITPPNVNYTLILRLVFCYSIIWVFYGLGFYCLVRSYSEISFTQIIPLISIFALAQIAGFMAFFAPAGLGVREGILLLGLLPILGETQALMLIILCRLWQTALEILMTAIGSYIFWYKKIPVFSRIEKKSKLENLRVVESSD